LHGMRPELHQYGLQVLIPQHLVSYDAFYHFHLPSIPACSFLPSYASGYLVEYYLVCSNLSVAAHRVIVNARSTSAHDIVASSGIRLVGRTLERQAALIKDQVTFRQIVT